ncbi:unnamed protein product [Heligmosomoides polygyrus]|uniref:Uncharacterized protein n=1 Tax=Heligmosomoides polygyrus TaxID=6339 RepID=A0A183FK32_HELPZ|nr:unnamed protein product [Heligmosomoides polygyrus]
MFYYYLFLFCLLYDILCGEAHFVTSRHAKEAAILKRIAVEKAGDDLPQYIDEVIESAPDSLPMFDSLRLG